MQLDEVRTYVHNVNWNRPNAGSNGLSPMECYLNVEAVCDGPAFLAEATIEEPDKGWSSIFWDKDGKPRELCFGAIPIDREFTGVEVSYKCEQADLFDEDNEASGLYANVRKISFTLEPGSCVRVKFQLQMRPSVEVWDHLTALLKQWVVLTLQRGEEEPISGEDDDQSELGLDEEEGSEAVSEGAEGQG